MPRPGNQTKPSPPIPGRESKLQNLFAAAFGAFLGITLLKFSNPPIMERYVEAPKDIWEFLLANPWPIAWGYALLVLVAILGAVVSRPQNRPLWLLALPAAWLGWQWVASGWSVTPEFSTATVKHFAAGVACFYLGCFALGRQARPGWFWAGLTFALLLVVANGWLQRCGGLAESRRYFEIYIKPTMKEVPPEYLIRVNSNRIFSTLFYPNALAGVILICLPPILVVVWQWRERFTASARYFLVGTIALASMACLFWSGSKGGWLLMLLLGLLTLLRLPINRKLKRGLLAAVLVIGLAAFFLRFAGFFHRGATSVSARFDYWEAALKTALANPVVGTGPGTFGKPYEAIKRPESESSRLVHNDYLQQSSDSGVPGFLLYTAFVIIVLSFTFPRSNGPPDRAVEQDEFWFRFAVWLGVLAFALQSLLEFSLYLPALAWTAMALAGWLLAVTPSGENGTKGVKL